MSKSCALLHFSWGWLFLLCFLATSSDPISAARLTFPLEQANLLLHVGKQACLLRIGLSATHCFADEVNTTPIWSPDGEVLFYGQGSQLLAFELESAQTSVLWTVDSERYLEPIMSHESEMLVRIYAKPQRALWVLHPSKRNKDEEADYGQLWRLNLATQSATMLAPAPSDKPLPKLSRYWPHAYFGLRFGSGYYKPLYHLNAMTGELHCCAEFAWEALSVSLDGRRVATGMIGNGRYAHSMYDVHLSENLERYSYYGLSNGSVYGVVWRNDDTFYYLESEFEIDDMLKKTSSVRLRRAKVSADETMTMTTVATFPFRANRLLISADREHLFVAQELAYGKPLQWWQVSWDGEKQQRVGQTPWTKAGNIDYDMGNDNIGIPELIGQDLLPIGSTLYHLRTGQKIPLPQKAQEGIKALMPRPKATFPVPLSAPRARNYRVFPSSEQPYVVHDGDIYHYNGEAFDYHLLSGGKRGVKSHFYDTRSQQLLYQEDERLRLASADGTLDDLTPLLPPDAHPFSLTYNTFSPDGRYFVLHSWQALNPDERGHPFTITAYLLDLEDKTIRRLRPQGGRVSRARWFSPQRLMLYEDQSGISHYERNDDYRSVLLNLATNQTQLLPLGEPDPTWNVLVELSQRVPLPYVRLHHIPSGEIFEAFNQEKEKRAGRGVWLLGLPRHTKIAFGEHGQSVTVTQKHSRDWTSRELTITIPSEWVE